MLKEPRPVSVIVSMIQCAPQALPAVSVGAGLEIARTSYSFPTMMPILISAVIAFSMLAMLPILPSTAKSGTAQQPSQAAAPAAQARQNASRLVVDIKGMSCESCEKTIRAMLLRTPGVTRATVSAKAGRAVVVYDATRTKPGTILGTINRLGYSAKLAAPRRPVSQGSPST